MRNMRAWLVAAGLLVGGWVAASPSAAQTSYATVVTTCGTPPYTYTAGTGRPLTQDTTGTACVSSSGGGGGAVTIADGADVTQGAKGDTAATSGVGSFTNNALLKGLLTAAQDTTAVATTATLQTQTDTVMVGGVNVKEINAVTPLMGNGVTGTGSQRVTIASDNTAFSVNGTLQTQTDTVMVGGVNLKEINAVTPLMGNGVTGTGSQRVTIASDNTAFSVNAAQATAANLNAQVVGTAAANAAAVGNPVQMGCLYSNFGQVLGATGRIGGIQCNAYGIIQTAIADAGGNSLGLQASNNSDAKSGASASLPATGFNLNYNGSTWDLQRNLAGAVAAGTGVQAVGVVPTSAASVATTPVVSASAAATSVVAKASAGNLYSFDCKSSAAGNCLAYNGAVPGAGALTSANVLKCVPVAAGGIAGFDYGATPARFSSQISIIFSSSTDCDTYTASSTAKLTAQVQ